MKKRIKNNIPIIIAVIMLIALLAVSNLNPKETSVKKKSDKVIKTVVISDEETRGLWVTYMDLDMSGTDYSLKSFMNKFNRIAENAKNNNFNTLIVHIRPFSDALYKSKYYPNSHILSGKQGKNVGYDALKYMVEYSHKLGLKIHVWVNPYRIKHKGGQKLSQDNPYVKDKSLGVKVNGNIYLNPALKKARTLIENGVREIVENYDVDGVQFDDYFYPSDSKSIDKKQYKNYRSKLKENALPLDEWRIANVNTLVADCFSICHKYGKLFSISPQGNIENDYEMYADVKSWCSQYGYVDFICPQLYYSLDNPALKFKDALKIWKSLEYNESVKLYIGLAGYKVGTDSDSGTWLSRNNILKNELELVRKNNLKGVIFYSYADLIRKDAQKEVKSFINELN